MSTSNSVFSDEPIDGIWRLDPRRSSVEFRARSLWGLVNVKGRFDRYHGHLDLSADPAVELTIDAASVQTGHRKRDEHLRSSDFFDAQAHPQVRFVSHSVDQQDGTLKVRGQLLARGGSIPLELDARVRRTDGDLEIEAATSARHRELGMTWSPLGMVRARSKLFVRAHLTHQPGRST